MSSRTRGVAVAVNAWTDQLVPALSGVVTPVRGQILSYAPAPLVFRAGMGAGVTPTGEYGFYGIRNVIQHPDGSIWAFGEHSMYLDIPGDEKIPRGDDKPSWRYNRWFAWDKDGVEQKINLPMGDMENAVRLENGELVATGHHERAGTDHAEVAALRARLTPVPEDTSPTPAQTPPRPRKGDVKSLSNVLNRKCARDLGTLSYAVKLHWDTDPDGRVIPGTVASPDRERDFITCALRELRANRWTWKPDTAYRETLKLGEARDP